MKQEHEASILQMESLRRTMNLIQQKRASLCSWAYGLTATELKEAHVQRVSLTAISSVLDHHAEDDGTVKITNVKIRRLTGCNFGTVKKVEQFLVDRGVLTIEPRALQENRGIPSDLRKIMI